MLPPSVGQLEREISNRIRSLYSVQLGQSPSLIICHFFDTEIVISLEKSVTQAEQALINGGHENLAEQVRLYLDKIIRLKLKSVIEEVISKPVIDVMTNTNLQTGRTGIVVILKQLPEVRNPESIPKANLKAFTD